MLHRYVRSVPSPHRPAQIQGGITEDTHLKCGQDLFINQRMAVGLEQLRHLAVALLAVTQLHKPEYPVSRLAHITETQAFIASHMLSDVLLQMPARLHK